MRRIKFATGAKILSEGEIGDTAFLIITGSAEVTVGEGAKAKNVGTLDAGEVFGEMCLLDPGPRSATVKALTDIELGVMSYDEFMATVQENPEQAVVFMKTLVRRLRQMNEMMAKIDPGKRRLRDFFKDWARGVDVPDADWSDDQIKRWHAAMYYY
ncbi:MAG: Crp/Fnr family transcriptional regulator [Hyphomicrobiaceae bacterium]